MKRQLQGLAFIFFGILLILLRMSYNTERFADHLMYDIYDYAPVIGLIFGVIGVVLPFIADVFHSLSSEKTEETSKEEPAESEESEKP